MDRPEQETIMQFTTDFFTEDVFKGPNSWKHFEVFHMVFNVLTLTLVSCFLNELTDFIPRKNRPHIIDDNGETFYFVHKIFRKILLKF